MLSSIANHLNPSTSSVIHGPLRNAAAMYFNNLGVAHFHLRKHSLGVFYLHRAAEENMKALRDAHQQDGMSIFVFDSGFLEIFGFLKEKLGS